MDTLFEQHVAQNPALITFSILQTAIRFTEEAKGERGLDLYAALLVPPLVLHRRTAQSLEGRQMTEGLFLRMIAEDREITLGINDRLADLASQTFKAIHLGCSTKLFSMLKGERIELFPLSSSLPGVLSSSRVPAGVTTILAAAKRLGYCFATTDLAVIMTLLRVRF